MTGTKYLLPILALWILLRCIRSMLRERYEPETWAWLLDEDGAALPVSHWESIIGRSPSSDIVIDMPSVSKLHASLQRDGDGDWTLSDLRSREGTYINGDEIDILEPVEDGDTLEFGDAVMTFREIDAEERAALERRRNAPGRFIGPGITLLILSIFQAFLTLEFTVTAKEEYLFPICLGFFALMVTEWFCYLVTRSVRRTGFEPETLAFFLTTLGTAVCASGTPVDMFKQTVFIILGVALYFFLGAWLRSLERVKSSRFIAAAAALGLLAVNVVFSEAVFGAKNWLSIAGVSFQPSELVKVLYIYTGAATLDRLFARRNLFVFIVFSAICVIALALIGDFGTAVIFFATFLVISFMRSGSFATVFLAVSGAAMAGFLVISVKPYIADRFSAWGHVWEDVWDKGYQQTHALSAAASGGLFGKGAGSGKAGVPPRVRGLDEGQQHPAGDERGAALGDEGEGDAREGQDVQGAEDVQAHLDHHEADGGAAGYDIEGAPALCGVAHGKERERNDGEHGEHVDHEPQLLADHGEDKVVLRFGQVEEFLPPVAQAQPEHAAGANGQHGLHGLQALVLRIVPGVFPVRNA